MKKSTLVIALSIISISGLSQGKRMQQEKPIDYKSSAVFIPLILAPDFSITFTDGTPANLYSACNAGNTIVLDFFFQTCHWCQVYAPTIDSAYQLSGAGNGNIKFWGIDQGDNNAEVESYKATYGVTNPCASGTQGGGDEVFSTYSAAIKWISCPTYSVVCPDKTIYHDINWTPTMHGFDMYYDTCTIASIGENLNPAQTAITLMYPVPAQDNLNIHVYVDKLSQVKVELYDIIGNCVYTVFSPVNRGYYNSIVPVSALPDGTYFVKIIQDKHVADVQKIIVMN